MNIRWKEYPIFLQVLLGCLLFLFILLLSYLFSFFQSSVPGLELFARANSTRTSIALTSQALYGPFPTATGPTPTPSRTPSITPTPTVTPTATSTPTPIRYFIDTATPRTHVPGFDLTSTAGTSVPTSVHPTSPPPATRTPIPPTNPPRQPTNPPRQPTSPPPQVTNPPPRSTNPPRPTNPPRRPTKTPKPPRPTKTPKR